MRNPVFSNMAGANAGASAFGAVSRNFGNVATTRPGGVSLVPTPLKGSVTLPNYARAASQFLKRRAESPEGYQAMKMAGGGKLARMNYGAFK
jgi:hypothetical protein